MWIKNWIELNYLDEHQEDDRAMAWKRLRPLALNTVGKSMYIGALISLLAATFLGAQFTLICSGPLFLKTLYRTGCSFRANMTNWFANCTESGWPQPFPSHCPVIILMFICFFIWWARINNFNIKITRPKIIPCGSFSVTVFLVSKLWLIIPFSTSAF